VPANKHFATVLSKWWWQWHVLFLVVLWSSCSLSSVKTLGPTFDGCTWHCLEIRPSQGWNLTIWPCWLVRRKRCLFIITFLEALLLEKLFQSRSVTPTGGAIATASLYLLQRDLCFLFLFFSFFRLCVSFMSKLAKIVM
jgi:hypothetical protein